VFVKKIQPWSGGGGSNSTAPIEVIISNTLAVTASGSDTEIELINGFTDNGFSNPYVATTYSNNIVQTVEDFTIGPPTDPIDGAMVYYRIVNNDSNPHVVSLDPTISVPSLYSFPVTLAPGDVAYLAIQYDSFFAGGAWHVLNYAQFVNGPNPGSLISETLFVNPLGGAQSEVELINGFAELTFNNPLQAAAYTNVFCEVESDFNLTAPTGGNDGAVVNLRLETAGASNVTMNTDGSFLIPEQLAGIFPFTITPITGVYLSFQFDESFSGEWYLSKFLSVTT
jgi:hypothetical protein